MIKVLFICHGSNARFQKNPVNARVARFKNGIFIPDLYQFLRILGCDMAKKMNSISVARWLLSECYFA